MLLSFAYIGAFTFGGGYAMLPMFQRELVEKNKWLTEEEMVEIFSISQCLPGIIAANTAVFVGYKQKGIAGGIVSALGVVMPSLIVIMILAAFISNFADIPAVQSAFTGLRVCVSVLIINAVLKLRKHSLIDLTTGLLFIAIFLLSVYTVIPVAILVISAGFAGIAISTVRKKLPATGYDESGAGDDESSAGESVDDDTHPDDDGGDDQ